MKSFVKAMLVVAMVVAANTHITQAATAPPVVNVTVNGGTVIATQTDTEGVTKAAEPTYKDSPTVRSFFVGLPKTTITVVVPSGKTFTGWSGDTSCGANLTCEFIRQSNAEYKTALNFADKPAPVATPQPAPAPARKTVVSPSLAPIPPTITEGMINDKVLDVNTKGSYSSGEEIKFSGKTVPNAKVHLYIHSNPREAEVMADETGMWEYSVKDLESGEHSVHSVVTDPVTGLSSEKTLLAKFDVLGGAEVIETTRPLESTSNDKGVPLWMITGSLAVLLGIAIAYVFIRRHLHLNLVPGKR